MRTNHGARLLVGLLSALFLGVVSPSCKPAAGGFCSELCECYECGGSKGGCVDGIKESRERADGKGCSGEFDEYLSCSKDRITCGEEPSSGTCEEEANALVACGGPTMVPCEVSAFRMSLRSEECGLGSQYYGSGGYCPPEYAVSLACLATCAEIASCEALAGTSSDPNDPYFACIIDCPSF